MNETINGLDQEAEWTGRERREPGRERKDRLSPGVTCRRRVLLASPILGSWGLMEMDGIGVSYRDGGLAAKWQETGAKRLELQ
jgi:hypothetical protein